MQNRIFFHFFSSPMKIIKSVVIMFFCIMLLLVQACTYNESYIKSISNDITTNGFLNDDCYQCIITARPDPGIEGLVSNRESAHINLIKTLETQCYQELYGAVVQLHNNSMGDSSFNDCLLPKLKPYIDKRVIVVTYYNEDYSKTAVIRIYESRLKHKLASLQCK
ncbi:MAG: hypothetical protein N3F66_08880 [Spirochaetes bacterium]|nr:hypothetical protein [Spirochaetota bacterium]